MATYTQVWAIVGPASEIIPGVHVEVTTKGGKVKREEIIATSLPFTDKMTGQQMLYGYFMPHNLPNVTKEQRAEDTRERQEASQAWQTLYQHVMSQYGGIHQDDRVSKCDIPKSLLRLDAGMPLDQIAAYEGYERADDYVIYINDLYAKRAS